MNTALTYFAFGFFGALKVFAAFVGGLCALALVLAGWVIYAELKDRIIKSRRQRHNLREQP